MAEFLLRALAAGIGVSLVAGPLGAFIVWRRMAYFGDTLAHSALLGIALGFMFDINLNLAIVVCCALIALVLVSLQQRKVIATDTLLGILAHTTLALGLIAVSLLEGGRVNLTAYLFGDLLAVTSAELIWVFVGTALVLGLLITLWRPLLAITIDEDLAKADGYPVGAIRLALMLMIAIVIAVAMKIVGVLLITALMIIPAAAARRFAQTPESMAFYAAVLGMLAVCLGMLMSLQWDTPTGPSIVAAAGGLFLLIYTLPVGKALTRV